MKTEQPIDRLLEAFLEIKKGLDEKLTWFDEQIQRARLEYLEDAFQQHKDAVVEVLNAIDRQLIEMAASIEEYQRLRASLAALTERIRSLGGVALGTQEQIAGETLAAILAERIEVLRSQAKI